MTRISHHNPKYKNQSKGNFNLSYHLEMVSDSERVSLFKKGIDKAVNAKTVFCELGCGTGIFSIYAAKKAKKVYAVEIDRNVLNIARQNAENAGMADKITFINADASTVELPEKVDVAFCEMLSIWMLEEPQVIVMNHVRKNLLKPGAILLPEKVINLAELGNFDYVYGDIEIKAPIPQFTGIKRPRVMTESKVLNVVSFNQENAKEISGKIEFKALTSGVVNCVRLSSIVKIADGINFYSTDSLMPLTIVPLRNELFVKEGQKIKLIINYKHRDSIDNAHFEIKH